MHVYFVNVKKKKKYRVLCSHKHKQKHRPCAKGWTMFLRTSKDTRSFASYISVLDPLSAESPVCTSFISTW